MIRIFDDLDGLSLAGAEYFSALAKQACAERGSFRVALSGGSTPCRMYEILAAEPFRSSIRWERVHFFWSDERCVAASDPRSNAGMAHQALLERVPVSEHNIHAVQGNLPSAQAAEEYESELRRSFQEQAPIFDLILLGMGRDGHTASLFPHSANLHEKDRWVAAVNIPGQEPARVTFTLPLINLARQVIILVSGADKADTLHTVLEGKSEPNEFPVQMIRPKGAQALWLVDKAASMKLTRFDK